jgi:hypothetical protein
MIVYFSTVIRSAPLESGGELVKLDWKRKEVLGRYAIVPAHSGSHDANPRGGRRGGRGILVENGQVYVASYDTLYVFDSQLEPVRSISNPLFADLHEVCWDEGKIWASSTKLDGALQVSRTGAILNTWWAREDPVLVERYDLSPLLIDKDEDYRSSSPGTGKRDPSHVHLNAVALLDGRPLVLLNQFGCLVGLHPTEILVDDPALFGCHNVLVTRDRQILINDTVNKAIAVYDATGVQQKRIELKRYGVVRKILWRYGVRTARLWLGKYSPSHRVSQLLVRNISASRPVFVRGLAETSAGTILVGISPAAILEIDLTSGKLVDHYSYSNDVHVCVHGLTCV